MAGPFTFRPGTHDERIFELARGASDYRLPERFESDDIVVDVGMHIGGFCLAALERGCQILHAFEAEASNFACAQANLRTFGERVNLHNKAVWRSDVPATTLKFTGCFVRENTGGGGLVFWENRGGVEQEVETVAFDDVIRSLCTHGRRVRFLKMDCEGSEFPILLTSRLLSRIDTIAGEFHEVSGPFDSQTIPERARIEGVPQFTIEVLAAALERAGFQVEWTRNPGSHIGLFHAERAPRSGWVASAWRRMIGRAAPLQGTRQNPQPRLRNNAQGADAVRPAR
jgi:FkbM family methyltransferase